MQRLKEKPAWFLILMDVSVKFALFVFYKYPFSIFKDSVLKNTPFYSISRSLQQKCFWTISPRICHKHGFLNKICVLPHPPPFFFPWTSFYPREFIYFLQMKFFYEFSRSLCCYWQEFPECRTQSVGL